MPARIKYNAAWPEGTDDAQIECGCIRKGEKWIKARGNTEYFHYRNLFRLFWPEDDEHRWEDEELRVILSNQFVTLMGASGSVKTTTAAKYALALYACWPRQTTILVSSTDMRGLELRVFGRLKSLLDRARNRYPWFPGHVLDSKKAVATDDIDENEIRDLKDGITGVPTLAASGQFGGISKFIGIPNTRLLLIADECFPKGTLVDTPNGAVPIESISPGDVVLSAVGPSIVSAVSERMASRLVKLTMRDGRTIACTENHRFFTQKGWVNAGQLSQVHYMISQYESLQILRERNQEQSLLQHILQREVDNDNTGGKGEILHTRESSKNWSFQNHNASGASRASRAISPANVGHESHAEIGSEEETSCRAQGYGLEASNPLWQRHWTHSSRKGSAGIFPGIEEQLSCKDTSEIGNRIPNLLQSGRSFPFDKTRGRSRWKFSPSIGQAGTGFKENTTPHGSWVDRVEIIEQKDIGITRDCQGGVAVYNLQVVGHPSYSVNGFLVHNCSLMKPSFLDAIPNLQNNPWTKFLFLGNPLAQNDPLDKVSEPKDGWSSIGIPTKTMTWRTKYMNGVCLCLPGLDSPNFDYPEDQPDRFPYMVSRRKAALVANTYGEGSQQYCSQILGVRVAGLTARKVITAEICEKFGAYNKPVWRGETTKIYSIDAAYGSIGGDLCVGGWIEFGLDVDGKQILAVGSHKTIPVSSLSKVPPDDQIADYVKADCDELGIEQKNVFYDGRTLLAAAFARIWNDPCNPVDFGGRTTARPVAHGVNVLDDNGQTRPKLCKEHYSKFVTELWFSIRYTIESGQFRNMDDEILDDAIPREWKTVRGNLIEVESKKEMKKRTGKSPDVTDWLAAAVEGARRRGFMISKLAQGATGKGASEWLEELEEERREFMESRQLQEY
jgi:hypothetical protein